MEFCEYLTDFVELMRKIRPDTDKYTIEDHLTVLASLPPSPSDEFTTIKCPITADHDRLEGNKLFKHGEYKEALEMYTESLMQAPPYSKCAALAYANRSAALYHLKAYEECIWDIDRALDLPYPNDLRDKIISRKEEALEALNSISKSNEKNEKIVEELKLAHGDNAKLPGASHGIDIARTPQKGRKLVASLLFKPGDVMIIEKPYLIAPVLDTDWDHCRHCFKSSLCPIPCDLCKHTAYCSETCRTEAYEQYHRIECPIQYSVNNAMPLDVETMSCLLRFLIILTKQGDDIKGLLDDIKEAEGNSDPKKLGFTGEQFIGNTRKGFLSFLAGLKKKNNSATTLEPAYVACMLRNYTNFYKKNADIQVVAELLDKLEPLYYTSYTPIMVCKDGYVNTKANAIFPLTCLSNHACINNTIAYIDKDGRMILRASQYIRPGDQILHNYRGLKFMIQEPISQSCKLLECKRICAKCDKTFVYPPEKPSYINIDKRLKSGLLKNPYDIQILWKVLNVLQGKNQHYTLPAQSIKTMLIDAYEGRNDLSVLQTDCTNLLKHCLL